jgi:hypothetical protein
MTVENGIGNLGNRVQLRFGGGRGNRQNINDYTLYIQNGNCHLNA